MTLIIDIKKSIRKKEKEMKKFPEKTPGELKIFEEQQKNNFKKVIC